MWRRAGLFWAGAVGLVLLAAGPAAAAPELRLEPASGQPGDPFTVIGTDFEEGDDVEVYWGSESGPLLGTATRPDFILEATVPADAPPNSHPVVAVVRDGNAVSSSNASFQVTPGAPPEEPEPSTTTVPRTVTTDPPPRGSGFDPGRAIGGSSRGGLGVTGGLGGEDEPDLGAGQPPPGALAGSAATGATTDAGEAATTTTGVPAAGGPPDSAVPAGDPSGRDAAGTDQAADDPAGAALGPRTTSQSSDAVRSPALLLLGLAMVFGGGIVLAVRNRHRSGEPEELQ